MNLRNKFLKFFTSIGFTLSLVNPALAYAQAPQEAPELPVYNAGVDKSLTDYVCTPSQPADGHDLERCINRLYKFGVSAGALLLIFMLVYAGYMYMTGSESSITQAKGRIKNGLTGMAILLGSYVLLYFINPQLVVIKPIQPPIFDAEDLPTCEDVGFGEQCIIITPEGTVQVTTSNSSGGATGPSAKTCPGGLVSIGSEIPTGGSANSGSQICKELRDKLLALTTATKSSSNSWSKKWRISSQPFGPGHKSNCHSAGNPQTGTCVDVSFGPVEGSPTYQDGKASNGGKPKPLLAPRSERFEYLCSEIKKVGLIIHNEAIEGGSCGGFNGHSWATNWHLHLILPE